MEAVLIMDTNRISDLDVKILGGIAGTLLEDYPDDDLSSWEGSPFAWIKSRASATRGKIGERLVAEYLDSIGFDVTNSPGTDSDLIINGLRAEIKSSTRWKSGIYKFQQLRDQNYEIAICLGISPFDVHCWVLPKSIILGNRGKVRGLGGQHGGQSGTDTAWLTVNPSKVHSWLRPYGGTLEEAVNVLNHYSN